MQMQVFFKGLTIESGLHSTQEECSRNWIIKPFSQGMQTPSGLSRQTHLSYKIEASPF